MFIYMHGVQKTEQIWKRSRRHKAAESMKFFIDVDCLGS